MGASRRGIRRQTPFRRPYIDRTLLRAMKTALSGDVAMLDRTTREQAAAVPRKILERFSKRIENVEVRVSHLMPTGSTSCEVTVRLVDHVQVMARDRDQDALKAITKALERARAQVSQSVQRARRRRSNAAREAEAIGPGSPAHRAQATSLHSVPVAVS